MGFASLSSTPRRTRPSALCPQAFQHEHPEHPEHQGPDGGDGAEPLAAAPRARHAGALCRARQGRGQARQGRQGRGQARQGRQGRAQGAEGAARAHGVEPARPEHGRRHEAERLGELDGREGRCLARLSPRERELRVRRRRARRQAALSRARRHGARLLPQELCRRRRGRGRGRALSLCREREGRAQEGGPPQDDGRAEGRGGGQARG